ncbi:MAG: type III pantothenate kinase [Chloroflexota bacterium]
MLLVLDVSNTSTKFGVYDGERLLGSWRVNTDVRQTADEYGVLLSRLIEGTVPAGAISECIMSSVVPPLNATFLEMVEHCFGLECLVVSHQLDLGLAFRTDDPAETGADRIVNSLAAYKLYGGPCIVVKFGTATTFDAVSADGAFLGGAIAAGPRLSLDALAARAARLYTVELRAPARAISTTTTGNLQSGVVWGYVGLIEGLVARFKAELGPVKAVVATGWEAQFYTPLTPAIDIDNPNLTLEGLRFACEALRR